MRAKTPFNLLYSIPTFIFDLLAPPRNSGVVLRMLTADHLTALATPDGPLPYNDKRVRALVWEIKYHHNERAAQLAGEFLSELLLAEASECLGKPLLLPVPMHAERRAKRGYNQTELLCEHAMHVLNNIGGRNETMFDYKPDLLERIKNTATQQGLMRGKRLKNVKHSMRAVDAAAVKGRTCIVVDDVSTTGATFAEAKRALKAAGAQSVKCVALAQS